MHFTCLSLLAVLMASGCFNQAIARSIASNDKMTFMKLVTDVQYEIMELLETEDVVSMIDAIPSLSGGGKSIYFKRNKNYEVYIWDAEESPRWDYTRREHPMRITFRSYDVILNILKHFGSVIQRIYADNHIIFSMEKALNISRQINQYTSESLTHLGLGTIKKDTFAQFTVPFKLVEDLSFAVGSNKIDMNIGLLALNEQFPALRRLRAECWGDIDYNFIDLEFPQLEHLHLIVGKNAWNRKNQFESLIQKNSQSIRSFGIEHCPPDYVKVIEQVLPNIENLTLSQLSINESVHFQHVKHFYYRIPQDGYEPEAVKCLSFPSLDSVKIDNEHNREVTLGAWDAFFQKHSNMTRLHYINRKFMCDDLIEAGLDFANFPNLRELIIECSYESDQEKFIAFVKKHDKLVTFQWKQPYKNDETESLRKKLEGEWISSDYSDELNGYSFEKKPNDPYL